MSHKYLLLMSANKANAGAVKSVLDKAKKLADPLAAPLWIDANGVGVFIDAEATATELWDLLIPGTEDFKDALIVEVGPDWIGRNEAKPTHWLRSHLGYPRTPAAPRR